MRRAKSLRYAVRPLILLVSVLLLSSPARADRVDRLIRILSRDRSYKVRLQAAMTLGRLRKQRAFEPLVKALYDRNKIVQGASATALAQLGNPKAIVELERLLARSKDRFVVGQARAALASLREASRKAQRKRRIVITLGKITNKGHAGGSFLSKRLGDALMREFGKVEGLSAVRSGGVSSVGELREPGIKAFVIDGAIVSLTHRRIGQEVELSCSIKVSLATYPENSMKAFYSGEASMSVSTREFAADRADPLYAELLEGAAAGAREHIVQSYLRHQ